MQDTDTPAAPGAQPEPPARRLTVETLRRYRATLPPTARELCSKIGDEAAVFLLNDCAGMQLSVPKRRDANRHGAARWARYSEVIGEHAMNALSAHWGGTLLDVPICRCTFEAVRNAWVVARFDHLTSEAGGALSSFLAIDSICWSLAAAGQPLTFRVVQQHLNGNSRRR